MITGSVFITLEILAPVPTGVHLKMQEGEK